MKLDAFLEDEEPVWELLEQRLEQAGGRPERLGSKGVLELGSLYRSAAADLALARQRFPGDPVVARLEALVVRARTALYSDRVRGRGALHYMRAGYWQEIRANRRLLWLSLAATFVPVLLCALWAAGDPGAAIGLVPSPYRAAADPQVRHLSAGLSTQAAFASSIYTHNIGVTVFTFAAGITLGLGTLALLAYNGVLLGTLSGLTIQAGTFSVFLRYIVPHGVLELSCVSISGVAGLRLARALVEPGTRTRAASLRSEAPAAVLMVLGTAPWLVLAGLIEGIVTPRALPLGWALALGAGLGGLFWCCALTLGRHGPRRSLARR
jgi:uncharacterized membrane protein SpoIIM required for sporulation